MKQSSPLRCVIIEDVVGHAVFLQKKLEAFPKEVKHCGTAASINAAFMLIVAEKPHFIFLDISLIDGSGFTVLDKLAAVGAPIPYIIATSAFENFPYERQNPYVAYFLRYFEKPFVDSTFTEKLEEAVHAVWAKTRDERLAKIPQMEDKKMLSLNVGGGTIKRIDPSHIICLYVRGHDLTLYTSDGKIEMRYSLNRFMIAADLRFLVRISSNEAVNIHKVVEVRQPEWRVKMDGLEREPIVLDKYRKDFLEMLEVL